MGQNYQHRECQFNQKPLDRAPEAAYGTQGLRVGRRGHPATEAKINYMLVESNCLG